MIWQLFFENLSQRERLSEIKLPLQNQLCMQRRIFQENNPLLSQNTKSQSDDDFLGCCPSPVYLILGSSWDPLVPDPAFDRHFPSYWMDKCKTSSMIAKCGKIFCCNFVGYLHFTTKVVQPLGNQIRVVAFNVPQLTQASFLQKIKHCKMFFWYL